MSAEVQGSATLPAEAHLSERLVGEATLAGGLGAVAIMVWFLILDTIQGHPLYTPTVLGTVLFHSGEAVSLADLPVSLGMVALYTILHGVGFCFVGYVAVRLFVAAERHPAWLFGLLLFFIFFFAGFLAFNLLTDLPVFEAISVPAVLGGNFLAAFFMGRYLWRRHPLDLRQLL